MNELLEKLGTTLDRLQGFISENAPMVWQLYLKQQWIDAILLLIGGMLGFGVCFFLVRLMYKKWEDWNDKIIFPILGVLITFIIGMVFFFDGIRTILNPEYFALKSLLTLVK